MSIIIKTERVDMQDSNSPPPSPVAAAASGEQREEDVLEPPPFRLPDDFDVDGDGHDDRYELWTVRIPSGLLNEIHKTNKKKTASCHALLKELDGKAVAIGNASDVGGESSFAAATSSSPPSSSAPAFAFRYGDVSENESFRLLLPGLKYKKHQKKKKEGGGATAASGGQKKKRKKKSSDSGDDDEDDSSRDSSSGSDEDEEDSRSSSESSSSSSDDDDEEEDGKFLYPLRRPFARHVNVVAVGIDGSSDRSSRVNGEAEEGAALRAKKTKIGDKSCYPAMMEAVCRRAYAPVPQLPGLKRRWMPYGCDASDVAAGGCGAAGIVGGREESKAHSKVTKRDTDVGSSGDRDDSGHEISGSRTKHDGKGDEDEPRKKQKDSSEKKERKKRRKEKEAQRAAKKAKKATEKEKKERTTGSEE